MEIPVAVGEWMNTLLIRMTNANDGDCFCLPTNMHVHAFFLLKEAHFPSRDFKIKVATGDLVNG
jgi:hypothetical protein